MELKRKIDFAIKLLQNIPQDGPVELSYSGGKDSDVCLELAKMSGIKFEAIYKNTSIDPPGTIAHCRENGVTILQPKKTFFQIVEQSSMPTRRSRFCCEHLKEYKVYDRAIQGIRRSESYKRAARYKEPEQCRVYPGKEKARIYLPILEWKDEDVAAFIRDRGIKCAPVYYDEKGVFHVERRLGCIGCPLKSDNGKADFKRYPGMLRQMVRSMDKYIKTHPQTKSAQMFANAYNAVYKRLFCKTMEDYEIATGGGLFPDLKVDTKAYLEKYFGIDLTI